MYGFVLFVREKYGYGMLPYMDDFLVAPSPPGKAATETDAAHGDGRGASSQDT